jgi:hypothetical protein
VPAKFRCRYYLLATMKVQIWGCRGSIPRPNPEMARYGGNTPCIEVVASGAQNNGDGCGGDGHRIIFDMGSGAFDLGQKILVDMFQQKKMLADMEKERAEKEGGESSTSVGSPAKQEQSKFGGSILITHTHWDHIQGNNYDREFQFAQSSRPLTFLLVLCDIVLTFYMIFHFCRAPLLHTALPSTVRLDDLRSTRHSKDTSRNIERSNAT